MLRHLLAHRAPEFPKSLVWISGKEMRLADLRGSVVLLHFFSSSCAHSLRTLPAVRRFAGLYAPFGLRVIGVHTPEFAFEKDEDHVRRFVQEQDIDYPVISDAEHALWDLYRHRYLPHYSLINHLGKIVYSHVGEGAIAEIEYALQQALLAIGAKDLPAIGPDTTLAGSLCYRVTPEVPLGFLRGSLGNAEGIMPNTEEAFTDVRQTQEEGVVYLHGHFAVHAEYLEHTRTLPTAREYVRLSYRGFGVQLVSESVQRTATVSVWLDGRPLPKEFFGEDVRVDEDGETVVLVRKPRLYSLIKSHVYHQGSLELRVKQMGVRFYTVTVSGC